MSVPLPAFLSRSLALLILIMAVMVVFTGVVQPVVDEFSAADESIIRAQELLPRYQRVGARLPQLKAESERWQLHLTEQGGLLKGSSDALVGAEIQERIKQAVEESGGDLKSTQILPTRDEGRFRRLLVRTNMSGSTEALQKVLHSLESGTPFLFIDNLDVRSRTLRRQRSQSDEVVVLDIRFDLAGFVRVSQP